METMRVRLTFVDEVLGTASGDPKIHETYIASNAPDAMSRKEEVEMLGVDEVVEKGKTVFPKLEDGTPIAWNYQVKGFFKSACSAMRTLKGTHSSKLKAYKKQIDLRIFVFADVKNKQNRAIPFTDYGFIGDCQRPLRASTAQGERVALSDSESLQPGAKLEFDILMLQDGDRALVEEWLDYGILNGFGQWRNSGKGAFTWEEVVQ